MYLAVGIECELGGASQGVIQIAWARCCEDLCSVIGLPYATGPRMLPVQLGELTIALSRIEKDFPAVDRNDRQNVVQLSPAQVILVKQIFVAATTSR